MIVPDRIIRSERRTLAVSLDAFGRVTVRAPKNCADERIFSFLQDKQDWICRHKAKCQANAVALPTENLDGFTFLLLGAPCRVVLVEQKQVRFENQTVYLPKKDSKKRLVAWIKENAKRIFTLAVERKAKETGLCYQSVSVTSARGRWGSCSAQNALRFSFRLLYAPKTVIEYVIVHELAHSLHKNHSRAFWNTVLKYEPNYKEKRRWLKDHAALMEIF